MNMKLKTISDHNLLFKTHFIYPSSSKSSVALCPNRICSGNGYRFQDGPRCLISSKSSQSTSTQTKQTFLTLSSSNTTTSIEKRKLDSNFQNLNFHMNKLSLKHSIFHEFTKSFDPITQWIPSSFSTSISNAKSYSLLSSLAFLSFLFFLIQESPSMAETLSTDTSSTLSLSLSSLTNFQDFQSGFASALLLILFSEIGDKTFFIAALLATKKPNFLVFGGTFSALAIMTVISVFLGRIFHIVDEAVQITIGNVPVPLDDIAASLLLIYFGISTLLGASEADSKANEEQEEAEEAVASFSGSRAAGAGEAGAGAGAATNSEIFATFASVFVLVFLAEWGDKSFFATIALAAASSPVGVVSGAVFGHGLATLLAVLGGSFFGSFVSEKVISYTGGILFLVFAALTWVEIGSKIF